MSASNLTRYVDANHKSCSSCEEVKHVECFERTSKGADGLRGQCRDCREKYAVEYLARTVEKRAEYKKRYYAENRERILAKNKAWYEANKDERKKKQAAWYEANKEKANASARALKLRKQYGITQEDYEAMFVKQDGKCAICLEPLPSDRSAAIDHCHDTGRVRGLLHNPCNAALGIFQDDAETVERALRYLRGNSS